MMFAAARTASRASSRLYTGTQRWASTLLLSDPLTADAATPPSTQSAVQACQALAPSNDLTLLVVGHVAPTQAPVGVTKILHAATADSHASAETIAAAIQQVTADAATAGEYNYVIATTSKFGATVIPRAAALLGSSPITDIVEILRDGTCHVYIYILHVYISIVESRVATHTRIRSNIHYSLVHLCRHVCSSHVRWQRPRQSQGEGRSQGPIRSSHQFRKGAAPRLHCCCRVHYRDGTVQSIGMEE